MAPKGKFTVARPRYSDFVKNEPSTVAPKSAVGRFVTMLTTPADAFLPNKVPCGPRNTSMRSTSNRSVKPSPARLKTTPSSTAATEGSAAIEKLMVPTPRRNSAWFSDVPDLRKFKLGTRYCAFSSVIPPLLATASPPTTDTASGMSCKRSSRFCAVTMISAFAESSSAGASWAIAGRLMPTMIAALASNEARTRLEFLGLNLSIITSLNFGVPLLDLNARICASGIICGGYCR